MSHSILMSDENGFLDCFPAIGEGNYAGNIIDDKFIPHTYQNSLYIIYNLSAIYYLALKNIGEPKENFGAWLDGSKAKDVLPVLEKMFDEIISNPEIYKPLEPAPDPKTGERWGSYKSFCDKIYAFICACRKHPNADISNCY